MKKRLTNLIIITLLSFFNATAQLPSWMNGYPYCGPLPPPPEKRLLAAIDRGEVEQIKAAIDDGAQLTDCLRSCLYREIIQRDVTFVKAVMDRGIDVYAPAYMHCALYHALTECAFEVLDILLDESSLMLVDMQSWDGSYYRDVLWSRYKQQGKLVIWLLLALNRKCDLRGVFTPGMLDSRLMTSVRCQTEADVPEFLVEEIFRWVQISHEYMSPVRKRLGEFLAVLGYYRNRYPSTLGNLQDKSLHAEIISYDSEFCTRAAVILIDELRRGRLSICAVPILARAQEEAVLLLYRWLLAHTFDVEANEDTYAEPIRRIIKALVQKGKRVKPTNRLCVVKEELPIDVEHKYRWLAQVNDFDEVTYLQGLIRKGIKRRIAELQKVYT